MTGKTEPVGLITIITMKRLYFILTILALCSAAGCKKDSTAVTINLSKADSGRTVSVARGSAIVLTLPNPGDGGYIFNPAIYSSSILTLQGQQHVSPLTNATGDFGKDIWTFTAQNAGTSDISVTATRTATETITIFSAKIAIH